MAFVLIGVLFLVLRLGGYVQFSQSDFWAWVIVLAPFGLALLWWMWADASGYTRRKVMDAMEAKKAARREQQMVNLGQVKPGSKKRR